MIDGSFFVGSAARRHGPFFRAVDPATAAPLPTDFSEADAADVAEACALAAASAPDFAALAPWERARFLEAIGDALLDLGDRLIATAMAETGLPRARLEGERQRTINQLRLFAAELRRGEWLDVTIDPALPDRQPPRPDLRRMNVALGPAAIFGASNFPLAFSVAGGDTASAFAAGCPVIVKGHPAHPGTGELAARAILAARDALGLAPGIFSYLPGRSNALGAALVADPRIKAVAFTGSRKGGLALSRIAQARPDPVPVFAEMSAVNPVILLPGALEARAEALGAAFVASLTMGAGQFCTNPGLVIALAGSGLDRFVAAAAAALSEAEPVPMLTAAIQQAYAQGIGSLGAHDKVDRVAAGRPAAGPTRESAALFTTDAASFIADKALQDEVFGASSLIVRCRHPQEMIEVIAGLDGQLTATFHAGEGDEETASRLLPLLTEKAGRVLADGWPTGVEVCHAMVHGGPFPACTDGRVTSVGTLAVRRFLRPVCFQSIPADLLPPALRDDNPWNLPRTLSGIREIKP